MCDPDPVRPEIEVGIARAEARGFLQKLDALVPCTSQNLAPAEMAQSIDIVRVGSEHEFVFGNGIGKPRCASVGIEPERPLRLSPQYLAFVMMQERAAWRCRQCRREQRLRPRDII